MEILKRQQMSYRESSLKITGAYLSLTLLILPGFGLKAVELCQFAPP